MRTWRHCLALAATAACLASCASGRVTTTGGPSMEAAGRVAFDGPKARVAVAEFTDRSGSGVWTRSLGWGLADMLSTALFQTGRFIVLERRQIEAVLGVQNFGTLEQADKETSVPIGDVEGAELLVTGAVTELEADVTRSGPSLGNLGGALDSSHIAIDLRVVDARTARVVLATTVTGSGRRASAAEVASGIGGNLIGANVAGALGAYGTTSMGDAVRVAIAEAVEFMVSQTPAAYFHATH